MKNTAIKSSPNTFLFRKARGILMIIMCAISCNLAAQSDKKSEVKENPNAKVAQELIAEGSDLIADASGEVTFENFAKAESKLRKAISLKPESVPAKYNAGNNYYRSEKYIESTSRLAAAADVAVTKKEKHQAFHNLGNALFQQKQFEGAVEAYKNALRNDPTDEETRYNLQLAKKEKEKNGGGGGDDDKNEEQDKDENKDGEKNEKDNKGEGDQKEGDEGEKKETDDKGDEKKDEGEQKEDDKGKPDEKEKEQDGGKGDEDKKQPQQPQRQGQLSPQRVESLLKAMEDQEKKTQEKINAQKVKGAKVKTEKDW